MAEIVPIELGLTSGNVVTLWAPRWLEDGEEWEAFLGHGDDLYVFDGVAALSAFARTSTEHDLADHPEWASVPEAHPDELNPDDDHRYDLVGVPDLITGPADVWTLAELSDIVTILRSLAEVCDLEVVDQVLAEAEGFDLLGLGEQVFTGRAGHKLWNAMGAVVAKRWDSVLDAIDALVTTPEVDAKALAEAEAEVAAVAAVLAKPELEVEDAPRSEELQYWDNIGIDCVEITVDGRTGYTLRCYLDDTPVFLSKGGRTLIFSRTKDLLAFLADGTQSHSLSKLEIFDEIRDGAAAGEIFIVAGPENTYLLDGVDLMLGDPENANRRRVALAVELLRDAGVARGDEETIQALSTAAPLGWLAATLLDPDPERLAPNPPFDDEVAAWQVLVETFTASLNWDGEEQHLSGQV